MTAIVFVATAWGSRDGGANAFNQDLTVAVAAEIGDRRKVACVVPVLDPGDKEDAACNGVTLIAFDRLAAHHGIPDDTDAALHEVVKSVGKIDWWVGHDVITGVFANAAAKATLSRSAVILHTNYAAYASIKAVEGSDVVNRIELTTETLRSADAVFGVGPRLALAATNLLGESGTGAATKLLPGLADSGGLSKPPPMFSAITFGRLDDVDDRLKQGRLAVKAFARLVREARDIIKPDPRLLVIGVAPPKQVNKESKVREESADEKASRDKQQELQRLAEQEAGRAVLGVIGHEFMESRARVAGHLRGATVSMMLSLHEGFGLAGWDAIQAGVPLVLSRNSGLYDFLRDDEGGHALGCVLDVDIQGTFDAPHHRPDDIEAVYKRLREVANNPKWAKQNAVKLRDFLAPYTWQSTAQTFLSALEVSSARANESTSGAVLKSRKLTEPPPLIPSPLRDRTAERALVRGRLLVPGPKVIALWGGAGVGKTALVSQLINDFDASESSRFGGLDYLSGAGYVSVTGERLVERLARLAAGTLPPVWADDAPGQGDWYERAERVLRLLTHDVLIVIDQIEDLVDDDGRFHDRRLQRLVAHLARRTDHRVSLLLVSSQPLHPSVLTRGPGSVVRLGEPLSEDDAVDFVRDLAGPSAPRELLRRTAQAVRLVGPFPRNLELLVAAFRLDKEIRVGDLEDLVDMPPTSRADHLTERVLNALPPQDLTVVRALAVLAASARPDQLVDILHHEGREIVPARAVRSILDRLNEARFVRRINDTYELPPRDIHVVTSTWWVGERGDRARKAYLHKAAEYYGKQKYKIKVRGVEDLLAHLREIDIVLQMDQPDDALELMANLDRDHLRGRGHQYVLGPWRRRLLEHEVGSHYWRANLSALAQGALELDEPEEAISHLGRALAEPPTGDADNLEAQNRQAESDRLDLIDQLGRSHWLHGNRRLSQDFYSKELDEAEAQQLVPMASRARLGLAAGLLDLGDLRRADEHLQAADLATGASDGGPTLLHADVLLARAEVARLRGHYPVASHFADRAGEAARSAGNARAGVRALDMSAGIALDDEREGEALRLAQQASALASRTGVTDITRTAHATLAFAHLQLDQVDDAVIAARAAARFFRNKRAIIGGIALGIALHRAGADDEAVAVCTEVIDTAEDFSVDDRPYWVWESLGLGSAVCLLCGDESMQQGSIVAYRNARRLLSEEGALTRCRVLLDALAGDEDPLSLEPVRRAATGMEHPTVR